MAPELPEPEADFHGVPIPACAEKRILYHSEYRCLATYSAKLDDVDREMQANLLERFGTLKEDSRHNLAGKFDIVTRDNTLVHGLMDAVGTGFVQLKLWVDF